MPNYKNGSFKVNVPIVKNPPVDLNFLESSDVSFNFEERIINPLSQNELSEGWQLVIPPTRSKTFCINRNGHIYKKTKKYNHYFKIDLSKLPDHLWDKLKPVYEEGIYSYSTVKDNKYVYIVNPTVVDDDIRELANLCKAKYFNKERAIELLHSLEDNNIYGWVVLRAKKLIGNDIQLL